MHETFEPIKEAFEKEGVAVANAAFSITPYSLNTKLSFKFSNVDELLYFLGVSSPGDTAKIEHISKLVVEAGVQPDSFFYVNFYKPKVAEL
jgi:hypothetical protein